MALPPPDRRKISTDAEDEAAGKRRKTGLPDESPKPLKDITDPEFADPETAQDEASGIDEDAQPLEESGVYKDMATGVINSAQLAGTHLGGMNQGIRQELVSAAYVSDWTQLTDAEIMLRVSKGDDIGFNYLITKYQRQIVHFMFRMVHNQAVAEELAQEVFLRVYRSRETYRAEARFSTWLYRIATNLGVNHARDTKHERAAQNVYLDAPDPETGSTPDVADSTPNVEHDLLRDERLRAIRDIVMELPERQRTAVLMHKYQGMDYKQVGEVLKLSESATKSLLFRAYQTLRESLKEFV
jgi:RNA polymerase sigma-70 factor (ECF subfamily)